MQLRGSSDAKPAHIAGVRRNLRVDQDDLEGMPGKKDRHGCVELSISPGTADGFLNRTGGSDNQVAVPVANGGLAAVVDPGFGLDHCDDQGDEILDFYR